MFTWTIGHGKQVFAAATQTFDSRMAALADGKDVRSAFGLNLYKVTVTKVGA